MGIAAFYNEILYIFIVYLCEKKLYMRWISRPVGP